MGRDQIQDILPLSVDHECSFTLQLHFHIFPPPPLRISGLPGVALDDLVYIMTRLARQAEEEGFDKIFAAAEEATRVMKVRREGEGGVAGGCRLATKVMKAFAG